MADYFINRYAEMTGDSPERILDFTIRPCLRVNTLKTTSKKLKQRLEKRGVKLVPVPFLPDAFWYEAPFSLGATEEYLLGLYYLQEAASQLPALALAHALKRAGKDITTSTVLDMTAAPGSKTTQLSALMRNTGTLVATDADRRRAQALTSNLERCGTENVHAYLKDGRHVQDLGMTFDAVLLDAPCSGNFAVEKGWLKKRQPHDPQGRARLQQRLLRAALAVLKPGGILVYSTCSLEPEEDEQLLTSTLTDESLVDTGLRIGDPALTSFAGKSFRTDMAKARRLWPHRHGTQGFFLVAVRKAS